jgi:uncharacterized protein (DUF2235 family)
MAKNIFLLADGTGNAAASPFKTNVWRLYQAIDRTGNDQIAFYTDGVGTETFKPLRALGGAFGIGLARNVKDLYQFLCRNYDRGDRIFLFGFSRGAFTVRILAGLILRCGIIVDVPNENLRTDYVKHAYSEYKRDAAKRATATRWLIPGLWLRFLEWIKSGRRLQPPGTGVLKFPKIKGHQDRPQIKFIGVWDTVDAYGMPIDELKMAIDKWFWPMTLADRKFSNGIKRACHALSLDDERPTFRPVLWTDPSIFPQPPQRLTQVWFAGVHANVGGGYPDDGLAHVTLQWIMNEAQLAGARFLSAHRDEVDERVDAHGHQYDSRAGLAGYYRYDPRNVDDLCNDPAHGVRVAMPLVHDAAWERIDVRQVAYAPTSFPTTYSLAERPPGGGPLRVRPPLETPSHINTRKNDMELARNAIWRRKFAYFATVFSSAILVLLPAFDCVRGLSFWQSAAASKMLSHLWQPIVRTWDQFWQPLVQTANDVRQQLPAPLKTALLWTAEHFAPDQWLAPLLKWAVGKNFLPWAGPWLKSFANHPTLFLLSAVLLLWLFLRKSQLLQTEIFRRAEYAWR